MSDDQKKEDMVMPDFVSLTYSEELTPNLFRFGNHLMEGKLVGHKSPSGMVWMPGKGYDPITLDITTEADEVEVSDHGTLTGFTVITPVAYYGQEATEPFVSASVLLDGCSNPVGQQEILNLPLTELRVGLRVKAVWLPESERSVEHMSNRGYAGLDGVIAGFEPNGEPDVSPDSIKDHLI